MGGLANDDHRIGNADMGGGGCMNGSSVVLFLSATDWWLLVWAKRDHPCKSAGDAPSFREKTRQA